MAIQIVIGLKDWLERGFLTSMKYPQDRIYFLLESLKMWQRNLSIYWLLNHNTLQRRKLLNPSSNHILSSLQNPNFSYSNPLIFSSSKRYYRNIHQSSFDYLGVFTCCSSTIPFSLFDEPCRGTLGFWGHWILTNVCLHASSWFSYIIRKAKLISTIFHDSLSIPPFGTSW